MLDLGAAGHRERRIVRARVPVAALRAECRRVRAAARAVRRARGRPGPGGSSRPSRPGRARRSARRAPGGRVGDVVEDRIVAEAVPAPRRAAHDPLDPALGLGRARGRREPRARRGRRRRAGGSTSPRRAISARSFAVFSASVAPSPAYRAEWIAGRPAERGDREPGVVGDRRPAEARAAAAAFLTRSPRTSRRPRRRAAARRAPRPRSRRGRGSPRSRAPCGDSSWRGRPGSAAGAVRGGTRAGPARPSIRRSRHDASVAFARARIFSIALARGRAAPRVRRPRTGGPRPCPAPRRTCPTPS